MIDMPHFDTLAYVETLKTAGVPEIHAKAFARAQQKVITECLETTFPNKLATKADLAAVKSELKSEIAAVKSELKSEIAAVKSELKTEIAEVKKDVVQLKIDVAELKTDNKLFKWLFGFIISTLMAIASGVAALVLKIFL